MTASRAKELRMLSLTSPRRLIGLILAVIGYILSPLSWWNDGFVNIPLSIATAYVLNRFFGVDRLLGFYIGYLTTNTMGMFLLIYGGRLAAARRQSSRKEMVTSTAISLVYTVIASIVLHIIGLL